MQMILSDPKVISADWDISKHHTSEISTSHVYVYVRIRTRRPAWPVISTIVYRNWRTSQRHGRDVTVKMVTSRKCKLAMLLLQTAHRKWYIVCRIAPFPVTLTFMVMLVLQAFYGRRAFCIIYIIQEARWTLITLSFMAALCNRAGHIYFHPVVSSSFFLLFFLA